ncbi:MULTISPECIES: hypothetical protein [unclassified Agromyces]|uniref:hypothetical protein n=1 Tax=unclassified Agromyces TaxID=2639701 RepID=UPI0030146132
MVTDRSRAHRTGALDDPDLLVEIASPAGMVAAHLRIEIRRARDGFLACRALALRMLLLPPAPVTR